MADISAVTLSGRVGAEPTLCATPDGRCEYLEFPLAVHRSVKGASGQWEDRTDWYRCSCATLGPGSSGSHRALHGKLRMGDLVALTGRLRLEPYTGRDGQPRSGASVRVDSIAMPRQRAGGAGTLDQASTAPSQPDPADIYDGEIPF